MIPVIILLVTFLLQQAAALDSVVDLGYAKYKGSDEGNGTFSWLGMRYARRMSRLDGLRFAAPQDPLQEDGVVDATKFGSICIDVSNTKFTTELGGAESEDCLFANVFAPASATNQSALPVYVFIQGGGFNANANANYDGKELVRASGGQMVVVNFNYRVGPYGFLASKEIVADQTLSLNNGLKDQRQLLKWVQAHISQFGGDPKHVTLGGASAGAGSVVFQLTAYGGRNDNLFQATTAESQSFPSIRNVTESQFQYDALLQKAGCSNLQCLKDMDAVTFQKAVSSLSIPYPGAKNPPIYFWNPTLDYDFIKDYMYNEVAAGHFVDVPSIWGDDTNEGAIFTPNQINSLTKGQQFIEDQFPSLAIDPQSSVTKLLDTPASAGSTNWKQVTAQVYGDIRYICPGLNLSAAYVKISNTSTWNYRWNIGLATHVAELNSVWYNGTSASASFIHNYFVNFIKDFDPNANQTQYWPSSGNVITSPTWDQFGTGNGKRMLFDNGNSVHMEDVASDEQDKCTMIAGLGAQLQQAPGSNATATASPATASTLTSTHHSAASTLQPIPSSWAVYMKYLLSALCVTHLLC